MLAGCGGDDDSGTRSSGTPATGNQAGTETPQSSGEPIRGGRVVVGVTTDPNSLDPHTGRSGNDHTYFWPVTESLVTYDDSFNPVPQLAEAWELLDPLSLSFTLRPGVTFHDGAELDSEAVRVNLERVLDESLGSSAYAQMSVIDRVEAPDPRTVVLKLRRPSAPLILNFGDRGGQLLSPRQLANDSQESIARKPMGTGPFMVQEWHDGSHVLQVANPNYWGKDEAGRALPYLDELRFNIIPDASVRTTSVESGDTDIGSGIEGANFNRIQGNNKLVPILFEGFGTQHIRINLDLVPDVRVRRAMMWALNREEISQAAFQGVSTVGVTPIGPRHAWAFYEEIQGEVYEDLEKARAELSMAGLEKVSLKAEHQTYDRLAPQVIQAQLKRVGIELELDPSDALNKYHDGLTELFITPSFSIRADPDGTVFELYHARGAYNAAAQRNGGEFSIDPELDRLLEAAQETYDLEERAELYHQAERKIVMDAHGVFFGWRAVGWAHQTSIKGFSTGAEGKGRFARVWRSS